MRLDWEKKTRLGEKSVLQLAWSCFLGVESLVTCFALCHLESSRFSLQVPFIECEPNVCLSHSLEISTLSNFWLRTYSYREVVTFCVSPHVILFTPTSQCSLTKSLWRVKNILTSSKARTMLLGENGSWEHTRQEAWFPL